MTARSPTLDAWIARPVLALLSVAALAFGGDDVVDTVNVEVAGRDTVEGSLRPADERESFLIRLARGTTLKTSAKGRSGGGPVPRLDVLDPSLDVIARSPAAKPVKVPTLTIAESGLHRVRVCGDGVLDGDYQLKVRAKPPKAWSARAEVDLAEGGEETFVFAAGAGSVARLTLSLTGKSAFAPQILDVTGPDAFSFDVVPPRSPSRRHVVKGLLLPATGEYSVRFKNAGTGAGSWKLKVKLTPPKARRGAIDLTDDALAGAFAGEQAVFARTIDERGGVVDPPESHDTLGGISIDVPPGAMTEPSLILISESEPFFVADDINEGGATFEFGPTGLTFQQPALVTLPFDAQAYDDPGTEVTVALRDGTTGDIELVTGTVDVEAGTITFPTSHFSRFQPASPRPRPLVGGFVELEITGSLAPPYTSAVSFGLNAIRGAKGPRTGNAVTRDLDRFEVRTSQNAQRGGQITGTRDQRRQNGVVSAGATVEIDLGTNVLSYERGRSPDVLIRRRVADDRASVSLLLRRVKGKPTRGALFGDWNVVVVEYSAVRAPDGTVSVASAGQTFDLSVDAMGRATPRKSLRSVTSVPFMGGKSVTQLDTKRPAKGTLSPAGLMVRLDMELGHRTVVDSIDLHPVVRGDALVGVSGDVLGDPADPTLLVARIVILTRVGKNGTDGVLDGRSRFAGFDIGLLPSGTQVPVAGTRLEVLALEIEHDGSGGLEARGNGSTLSIGVAGGPVRVTRDLIFGSTYSIAKSLRYVEDAPFDGGVVFVRRGLYISTLFADDRVAIGFGLPARPLDE